MMVDAFPNSLNDNWISTSYGSTTTNVCQLLELLGSLLMTQFKLVPGLSLNDGPHNTTSRAPRNHNKSCPPPPPSQWFFSIDLFIW